MYSMIDNYVTTEISYVYIYGNIYLHLIVDCAAINPVHARRAKLNDSLIRKNKVFLTGINYLLIVFNIYVYIS